jgi:high-affinity K+ transport system ATPase subunit B
LSDVDLAVLPMDGSRWDMRRLLEVSAQLAALAATDDANVINLRSVPVKLQMRVLETGRPLFIRDEGALSDFAAGVVMRYADFEPALAAFYRDWDTAVSEEYS